jgi:mono/diheme cytochrome c family protein
VKKFLVLSIALIITAVVGFGCSGDAATPTSPSTSTSPAPTATSPAMAEATTTSPAMAEATATTAAPVHNDGGAELGLQLIQSNGCLGCHSIDGTTLVGPTWKGLYGSTRPLADGTTVMADGAYIEESILNSSAKIADGFPPIMPAFTFTADEIQAIIEYFETL